jgi:hypothetical protein
MCGPRRRHRSRRDQLSIPPLTAAMQLHAIPATSVDVSCDNYDCHGVAWVEGIDANWNELCYMETTGHASSMICPPELALFIFRIDGPGPRWSPQHLT